MAKRFLNGIWVETITITDEPINGTDGANKDYVDGDKYMKKLIDEIDSTTMYVGVSVPGSLESEPVWAIKRIQFLLEDIEIKWADSVNTYTKVWDDRLSYTYN